MLVFLILARDIYHVDTIVLGSNPDLHDKRQAVYQLSLRHRSLLVWNMIITSAQQRYLFVWIVMFHRDKSNFIRCWYNLLLSNRYLLVDTVCLGMTVDMKDSYIGFNWRCLSWNVQSWHFEMFECSTSVLLRYLSCVVLHTMSVFGSIFLGKVSYSHSFEFFSHGNDRQIIQPRVLYRKHCHDFRCLTHPWIY